ncbi:MAG TPA: signal peptidase I [Streptosporangiaceae bacterium]|jgi:signal peptidase I
MMNDEQGSPDRLTQSSGSPDVDGGPDRGGQAGGYRGAYAAGTGGADPGTTGQPDTNEATTGAIGAPEPAAPEDEQAAAKKAAARKRRSTWRELPILIVVALAIALVIKTFVVQPFYIPSSSMENTLLIGDKVLVNKLVYHFRSPQPGDVIVFNGIGSWNAAPPPAKPDSNPAVRAYDATLKPLFHSIAGLFGTPIGQTDYIKRVIGTPGDDVACCNAQGLVTVNGVPLHESSYLYPGAAPSQIHFNRVVPAGRLWVMGDNRAVSDDSRLRQPDPGGGTIPISQVVGRAFVIVWPPSHWRILSIPSTFGQAGISKATAAAAAGGVSAQDAAATQALLGTKIQPEAPYVPLAAGFAVALPLTWLQRRARRRLTRRLRAGRGQRPR